ncbi:MAG: hypothetical protein QGG02_15060 [Gammaproteobacteria bacterium]|jgi:hypothetical protein|nr:hypothetical protein [Gammaproteobacteria bacterium]MDP6733792.1 hypothetical protein [Gammaproteobacteria bacterium]|tara:strand:- start:617 stop:1162 length:546 start_codon:yes stop_codon:yes gene_type:complete
MPVQYQGYELLQKALQRDYWTEEQACMFFIGHWVVKDREGRKLLYDLITGKQVRNYVGNAYDKNPAYEKLMDDYRDLLARWQKAKHNHDYERGFEWERDYCLVWMQKKRPYNLFLLCLRWGFEQTVIKADDLKKIQKALVGESQKPRRLLLRTPRKLKRKTLLTQLVRLLVVVALQQRMTT